MNILSVTKFFTDDVFYRRNFIPTCFFIFYFFDKTAVCIGKADPEKQKN